MSSIVELPEDIWKIVLQHVPLKQRLSSCALVCQKFKAAAVAATDSIEATLFEQPAVDKFATYLQQHGSHLTSLVLTGDCRVSSIWPELEQLPCQHLQELHLNSLNLGWGPDEDRPSVLDHATAITRLEIQDADLYPAALSMLPSLQHLCIDGCYLFDSKDYNEASTVAFSSWQQLTHLGLTTVAIEAESLAHISSITDLHTLHIVDCCELTLATPGLSLPPSLQRLVLCGGFQPSVLAAATQLTHLDLGGAVELSDTRVCLLGILAKLQHLDYLCLSTLDTAWPRLSPAYQAFITSSSVLRVLRIDRCHLPDGALAHVLPSAPSHIMLPRLEVLAAYIPRDALENVLRSCPALQQLTLTAREGEFLETPQLAALSHLSALSCLDLSLEASTADASTATAVSIQSLAGLDRLQDLTLWLHGVPEPVEGPHALPQALLPLTALLGLTRLQCAAGGQRVRLSKQVGAQH